jgi:hypothetical protein
VPKSQLAAARQLQNTATVRNSQGLGRPRARPDEFAGLLTAGASSSVTGPSWRNDWPPGTATSTPATRAATWAASTSPASTDLQGYMGGGATEGQRAAGEVLGDLGVKYDPFRPCSGTSPHLTIEIGVVVP